MADQILPKLAIIWHRFGPYHLARIRALQVHFQVFAIEVSQNDSIYAWDVVQSENSIKRITIFKNGDADKMPGKVVSRAVYETLSSIKPDVCAVISYSFNYSLAALKWCIHTNKRCILMHDSQYMDRPRGIFKEYIKKHLIPLYDSALVSGYTHIQYLVYLGFPIEKIRRGLNVVDNEFFKAACKVAKENSAELKIKLKLPDKFFLCSARFIHKKNLLRLLEAYKTYIERHSTAWDLVILGDGKLRPQIEAKIKELLLSKRVVLPGFIQYSELPNYYALASAFILPSIIEQWGLVVNEAMACGLPVLVSNKCGCIYDLVATGVNGKVFDPFYTDDISNAFAWMSENENRALEMGSLSERIISDWGPSRFADEMFAAWNIALIRNEARHPNLRQKLILNYLTNKRSEPEFGE